MLDGRRDLRGSRGCTTKRGQGLLGWRLWVRMRLRVRGVARVRLRPGVWLRLKAGLRKRG